MRLGSGAERNELPGRSLLTWTRFCSKFVLNLLCGDHRFLELVSCYNRKRWGEGFIVLFKEFERLSFLFFVVLTKIISQKGSD